MRGAIRSGSFLAPILIGCVFAALLLIFVFRISDYHSSVIDWSRQELSSRAEQASIALSEPLRTLDMERIRDFGNSCHSQGYRLRIVHGLDRGGFENGHGFFDTSTGEGECLFGVFESGDYQVGIGRALAALERPYHRALVVIVLAALLGIAGMSLFFVTIWRQRIRLGEMVALEKFRSDFIADLSHEIKTPLTGILLASDMLKDAKAESAVVKNLSEVIARESRRLERMAQSVQDLARLEHEADAFHPKTSDLKSVIGECVEGWRLPAQKQGVRLVLEPAKDDISNEYIDASLMSMALSNLIGNALRHSKSPEVIVRVARRGGRIVIEVEDHGVGVPEPSVVHLFERFYRVDPSRTAETGGSGLGLAIVSRIALLHGGNVSYRHAVPTGSVFSIRI